MPEGRGVLHLKQELLDPKTMAPQLGQSQSPARRSPPPPPPPPKPPPPPPPPPLGLGAPHLKQLGLEPKHPVAPHSWQFQSPGLAL